MRWIWFVMFCVAVGGLPQSPRAAGGDRPGSADHPLIGRFEGAVINAYDVKDFDEYELLTGPVKGKKPKSSEAIEGRMTRIAYKLPAGHSLAEVARNYKLGLQKSGFELLFECAAKACGLGDFAYRVEVLPIPQMTVDPWNFRYLAARKSGPSGVVSASVLISLDTHKAARIQVFVVEAKAMDFKMVDAKQMAGDIAEKGRVALYGIYFDSDKATIKAASKPTLSEIARLLKAQPKLAVIVRRPYRQPGQAGL